MKRVVFKTPYRVGIKSGTTVLDANGIEVTNFRNEKMAEDYVNFLNEKEEAKAKNTIYVAGIDPYKVENPFKRFKRKIMFRLARFFNKKLKQ